MIKEEIEGKKFIIFKNNKYQLWIEGPFSKFYCILDKEAIRKLYEGLFIKKLPKFEVMAEKSNDNLKVPLVCGMGEACKVDAYTFNGDNIQKLEKFVKKAYDLVIEKERGIGIYYEIAGIDCRFNSKDYYPLKIDSKYYSEDTIVYLYELINDHIIHNFLGSADIIGSVGKTQNFILENVKFTIKKDKIRIDGFFFVNEYKDKFIKFMEKVYIALKGDKKIETRPLISSRIIHGVTFGYKERDSKNYFTIQSSISGIDDFYIPISNLNKLKFNLELVLNCETYNVFYTIPIDFLKEELTFGKYDTGNDRNCFRIKYADQNTCDRYMWYFNKTDIEKELIPYIEEGIRYYDISDTKSIKEKVMPKSEVDTFNVQFVYVPSKRQQENGESPKILASEQVPAEDKISAAVLAALIHHDKLAEMVDKPTLLETKVAPFGG